MIPDIYEKREVKCQWCMGRGWIPSYHNDTEDCKECSGKGIEVKKCLIEFEDLLDLADANFDAGPSINPSELIKIMRTYHLWQVAEKDN